jgi:hypothetical protein
MVDEPMPGSDPSWWRLQQEWVSLWAGAVPPSGTGGAEFARIQEATVAMISAVTEPFRVVAESQRELADRIARFAESQQQIAEISAAWADSQARLADLLDAALSPRVPPPPRPGATE